VKTLYIATISFCLLACYLLVLLIISRHCSDYDNNREDEQEYEDDPVARCIAKLHNETATLYHELQETFSVPAFTTSMDEISKELWTLLEEDFQWPALETLLLQDEDGMQFYRQSTTQTQSNCQKTADEAIYC